MLGELDYYYRQLMSKQLQQPQQQQHHFIILTSTPFSLGRTTGHLTYTEKHQMGHFVYLGQLNDEIAGEPKDVIIKFTKRYSRACHEACYKVSRRCYTRANGSPEVRSTNHLFFNH